MTPFSDALAGSGQVQNQNQTQSQAQSQAQNEGPKASPKVTVLPASAGHFDELRGVASKLPLPRAASVAQVLESIQESPSAASRFFACLGPDGLADLPRRAERLSRQVRDNGITYNVYADGTGGVQRPWALDLLPLVVSGADWTKIQSGIAQRARLLNAVMADVYGPQTLLQKAMLPAALVQGQTGYVRAMRGVQPRNGVWLHIAAFDLAHSPSGDWWVVSQRTQAPSGLGYLLENRMAVGRQFTEPFRQLHVQRLAATYQTLLQGLRACSPQGDAARIVLLTPGPYNETYFEHVYLARYLGLTLVEGSDLLVRNEHLYLRTLKGLEPVHGILKRLDDEYLDPLELRADSTLGVPGLLQAIRAGNVLVANAPGSGFLESPALLGFLPALSEHLLGEKIELPALSTWWCGEAAALVDVLPRLSGAVIKPTTPGAQASAIGPELSRRELDEWTGRLVRQPEDFTVQQWMPLSQTPTWSASNGVGQLIPKATMLRVFAVSDGAGAWKVLPGGLARLAQGSGAITSMQHGGSSADVWVLGEIGLGGAALSGADLATDPSNGTGSLIDANTEAVAAVQPNRSDSVSSRAAENLFWFGRYTERCEHSIRLVRIALELLSAEDTPSKVVSEWLTEQCMDNNLVPRDAPSAGEGPRDFEKLLIAGLTVDSGVFSVGHNLHALRQAADAVRERLSRDQWNLISFAHSSFSKACDQSAADGDFANSEALRHLATLSNHLSAITGAQTDRMSRDDGWRCLTIGRQVERLIVLSTALVGAIQTRSKREETGFDALLELFDSTITFRARYQLRRDLPALLALLVTDGDNPRSLAWVAQQLRGRLSRLAGAPPTQLSDLALIVPDASAWDIGELAKPDDRGQLTLLITELHLLRDRMWGLSEDFGARYFSHAAPNARWGR